MVGIVSFDCSDSASAYKVGIAIRRIFSTSNGKIFDSFMTTDAENAGQRSNCHRSR